ncbi:MAG: hypothetical protein Q9162_006904 [Coniocarpon cinnabarinum]
MAEALNFPQHHRQSLEPYLPQPQRQRPHNGSPGKPHVTLTYAMSLDAMIAAAPGTRTALSGAESKAMTHYLRTRHTAILVGRGTAQADDPALNSRLEDAKLEHQPRPVVLDGRGSWRPSAESKIMQMARAGRGLSPWVLTDSTRSLDPETSSQIKYLQVTDGSQITWPTVLQKLHEEGIDSVMIEGGAEVIQALLKHHMNLVDSLIVTVAPVFLGDNGVRVTSDTLGRSMIHHTQWITLGADVVMCAKIKCEGESEDP